MAVSRKTRGPVAKKTTGPAKAKTAPSSKKAAAKSAANKKAAKPPVSRPAAAKKKEVRKGVAASGKVMKKAIKKEEPQKDRIKELKSLLLKKREAIVKEAKDEIAKYISGETRQLVDTAVDEGDWAVVDISEDINLMRLGSHRKMLFNIDEALRKLREGSYGICEDCGEEISEKRLGVMPTATLCISCQENKEQLEAISREETE